ncbi:MAG: hypothetical protein VXX04_04465 [Actinomycetota bacterium]|nr:hypothetical protein [Actinomycetota bacterium]
MSEGSNAPPFFDGCWARFSSTNFFLFAASSGTTRSSFAGPWRFQPRGALSSFLESTTCSFRDAFAHEGRVMM